MRKLLRLVCSVYTEIEFQKNTQCMFNRLCVTSQRYLKYIFETLHICFKADVIL